MRFDLEKYDRRIKYGLSQVQFKDVSMSGLHKALKGNQPCFQRWFKQIQWIRWLRMGRFGFKSGKCDLFVSNKECSYKYTWDINTKRSLEET